MYKTGESSSQQKVPDRCETATSAQIRLFVDGGTLAHGAAALCTGSETQSRRAGTFISMPAGSARQRQHEKPLRLTDQGKMQIVNFRQAGRQQTFVQ